MIDEKQIEEIRINGLESWAAFATPEEITELRELVRLGLWARKGAKQILDGLQKQVLSGDKDAVEIMASIPVETFPDGI